MLIPSKPPTKVFSIGKQYSSLINQATEVLSTLSQKYEANDWLPVSDTKHKYFDSTIHHISAWWKGELIYSKSGLPHAMHIVSCLLFLLFLEGR